MAGIDIFSIKPSVVSRDLKGKFVCIYGNPKCGKTTLACKFPKNLLLGFEHGYNAIAGAMAIDILKWADFKTVLKQLAKEEAKEMYNTITLDTIGIAWKLCEEYICMQQGVDKISDVPYGGGYGMIEREFERCLRTITQLGYGLVIIAHVDSHIEKDADGSDKTIIGPMIPKRAYNVVNQLVDIIGFIHTDSAGERWLYTRGTPTVMAGSRFEYMPDRIHLGYTELVNAIADSIDQTEKNGGTVVDKGSILPPLNEDNGPTYEELMAEIKSMAVTIIKADHRDDYSHIVSEHLGAGKNVQDCTADQRDILILIHSDLKDYLNTHKM